MEPMGGSVGMVPFFVIRLRVTPCGIVQVMLAYSRERDPKPAWAGSVVVWMSDSGEMPLIIPS